MGTFDSAWPAWAANGLGLRRTRLLNYALLAVCALLGAYLFVSWESLPTIDDLKSQYGTAPHPPHPPPPLPLLGHPDDDEPDFKSPTTVTVTAAPVTVTVETTATATPREACIDPYRRPGFLHVDNTTGDYSKSRWIPYTTAFLDAEDPQSATYPYNATEKGEIWFDWESVPDSKFLDHPLTPTNWMDLAVKESSRRKNGEPGDTSLAWLTGRVILLVSDSVDRYNTQWFCEEFRDRSGDDKASFHEAGKTHSTALCTVPSLNITIVHWHLAGMTTYMPAWWWDAINVADVPFEERYDKIWSATFKDIVGINGKGPDLVLWQSTVWDRKNWLGTAKAHYGEKHPMASYGRGLVWDEVRFYTARVKTLLKFLQEKLGKDVPMMLRTVTLDRNTMKLDVQPYAMDRINRVIGEKYGIEPFEWGRLIAGQADLYKDSLHPGKGASSWLWGTMVLEYLARAVGAGTDGGARAERAPYFDSWGECHKELTTIGSNAYH